MNILIACEFSGIVRDAFRDKGHNAWSCDLEGVEPNGFWANYHWYGDCRFLIKDAPYGYWDMMIAHPPCTYLSNSGSRWLYKSDGKKDLERWENMIKGAEFFKELLSAPIQKICIENPIMHGYAKEIIGKRQDQLIQPWMFGHPEVKATCLWLKNLPLLHPTKIMEGRVPNIHWAAPGPNRGKERSITYKGIAEAMADQWG